MRERKHGRKMVRALKKKGIEKNRRIREKKDRREGRLQKGKARKKNESGKDYRAIEYVRE